MYKLTIEEIKTLELAILKDVASFCEQNNIRYYLSGGTLLGAVRHKGFIPWDDDSDISMPRPDYIKFVRTYNGSNSNYYVKSIEIDNMYWRTFAKVFDSRTKLIENFVKGEENGNAVFVDIFPIDGLPASWIKQQILFRQQEILNFLYRSSAWKYTYSNKYKDSKSKFADIKGGLRTACKFIAITLFRPLPTAKLIKVINKNASRWAFDEANYIGVIVDCTYGASCEKVSKSNFVPRILFDFENEKFWGPKGYKEYLTNLYGDYMELPPINRRITHHNFEAYWKIQK